MIVETNCELLEFRLTAIIAVCVRSGRMLSVVPRRIEVHSSYHQLRKETHFSDFRTHAFPTGVTARRSHRLEIGRASCREESRSREARHTVEERGREWIDSGSM